MKRILSILLTICLCSALVFADEQGDEYDDGYDYQSNMSGDQLLKLELDGHFPLNFDDHLKAGFGINIGYYKFIAPSLAVGGELTVTNNFSIGGKALFIIPITFGAMYQPQIGKFEFPIMANIGFATETWANQSYWPALTARASAGCYYRMSESWSFGGSTTLTTVTEYMNKGKNYTGVFLSAGINARYHF